MGVQVAASYTALSGTMAIDAETAIVGSCIRIRNALHAMPPTALTDPTTTAISYHNAAARLAARSGNLFSRDEIELAATRDKIRRARDTSANESKVAVGTAGSRPVGDRRRNAAGDRSDHRVHDDVDVTKYYVHRYDLFSLYDRGVVLDRESWYSVCPESIALHIARTTFSAVQGARGSLRSKLVAVEGFCGAGGNAIALAFDFDHVIAIDHDRDKLAAAWVNASIYGVADRITFVHGDFRKVAPKLKGRADVVYMCPPWSGPGYAQQQVYDLGAIQPDVHDVIECARLMSDNVVISLPRNTNEEQALSVFGPGSHVRVEKNWSNPRSRRTRPGRPHMTTFYSGPAFAPGNVQGTSPLLLCGRPSSVRQNSTFGCTDILSHVTNGMPTALNALYAGLRRAHTPDVSPR
ncbi:Trimethylguanosine synthase [Plasmodiophora brassicae]|uniref:Trimethylguanosine synthase n=1 Tax=Plasmodiophora brassicae TaxID=37360 RepID=A0A0G4ISM0_PLABS|nr:hypothetical protein PBRA_006243 [Plasmodiophora brassicae]